MICSQLCHSGRAWQDRLDAAPHGSRLDDAAPTSGFSFQNGLTPSRHAGASVSWKISKDFVLLHTASAWGWVGLVERPGGRQLFTAWQSWGGHATGQPLSPGR